MTLEQYLQKKYSPSTFKSNGYHIKRFTNYYGKKAEKASYQDVLQYVAHLRKNYDLHPKTLRHCLYGVKIYFNYLLAVGKRKDHPCSELVLKDRLDKSIQVDQLYSAQTLEQQYESYPSSSKNHVFVRNKIILGLLIYQALTVQEIVDLKVVDVDLNQGEILIKKTAHALSKSPKQRTLPLQAKQILLLNDYLKNDRQKFLKLQPEATRLILGRTGKPLHPHGITRIINEHRPKSEQLKPQKIRQSVIANWLKNGHDTRVVQVFAGHRRASTTTQ